jgi:hypothetical protein
VVRCQRNDSIPLTFEDRIGGYKKGIGPFPLQRSKSRSKIQVSADP